jgi:hypothetical protein
MPKTSCDCIRDVKIKLASSHVQAIDLRSPNPCIHSEMYEAKSNRTESHSGDLAEKVCLVRSYRTCDCSIIASCELWIRCVAVSVGRAEFRRDRSNLVWTFYRVTLSHPQSTNSRGPLQEGFFAQSTGCVTQITAEEGS